MNQQVIGVPKNAQVRVPGVSCPSLARFQANNMKYWMKIPGHYCKSCEYLQEQYSNLEILEAPIPSRRQLRVIDLTED